MEPSVAENMEMEEDEKENVCGNDALSVLRRKKEELELLLAEKSSELKKLCIAEAELTGVLPLETPLEDSGSPPKFRKRVGTMFPFTEEMISRVQVDSKGRVLLSPKRSRPKCQWLAKYDTLPTKSSPKNTKELPHSTWSHPGRSSPCKAGRVHHPYLKLSLKKT